MDLSHMNHTVLDNGHELSLRTRYNTIARNQDAGVGGIEVQLHGSKHSRAKTVLRIGSLDLKQQVPRLLA
jgi:hypothetical protein